MSASPPEPRPRRRPGPRSRLLVAALVVGVLVSACTGNTSAGSSPPSPRRTVVVTPAPEPPGIRLSFIQQRFDEGTAKANITVMNYSGRQLPVRSVGLDWPGYPGPPQRRPYLVPTGFTIDLRYWLPRPDCRSDAFATAPVGVVTTATGTIRRRIDAEGLRFLRRIWKLDCNQRLLRRSVRLEYAGPWRTVRSDGEPALLGSLVLTRRSGHTPIALTDIQGSPIFELALGHPRTLDARRHRVGVPLVVSSGHRCDPHSRGQVTTPFTFRLWATIGGEPVTVIAVPAPPVQVRMLAFLDRACAGQ